MSEPADLLKIFMDDTRLLVLAQIAREPLPLHTLAVRTGLPESALLPALARLRAAGLLREAFAADGFQYAFQKEPLISALRLLRTQALPPDLPDDAAEYDKKVLGDFLDAGRLKSIPVQQKKRDVVLRYLASQFAPGRDHPEREVNALLNRYHADHATLRRALVDGGWMVRAKSVYRRAHDGRLI